MDRVITGITRSTAAVVKHLIVRRAISNDLEEERNESENLKVGSLEIKFKTISKSQHFKKSKMRYSFRN